MSHNGCVLYLCWNEALPGVPRLSGVTAPCSLAKTPGCACSETQLKEGPSGHSFAEYFTF